MKELTEKACMVYLTLRELIQEDADFAKAFIVSIEQDLMMCESLGCKPSPLVETWIKKTNYYFTDDEKDIIRQLLKQFGLIPMLDAVNKIYNQICAEMVLFDLGITIVDKDEWDLKEEN